MARRPSPTCLVAAASLLLATGAAYPAAVYRAVTAPTHVSEISSPPPADEVYPAGGVADAATWYIADSGQNRVVTATSKGFSGVLSSAVSGGWKHPKAIAADPDAVHLWVADTDNQRVVEIDTSTGHQVKSITSGISSPYGLVADASRVYVANTYGHDVRAYRKTGTLAWSLASCLGEPLSRVRGVALGSDGRLYATDTDNARILVIDPVNGRCLSAFGAKGKGNGQYNQPWALANDGHGGLWVADSGNYRAEHVTNGGAFIAATNSSFGSGANQFATLHCVFMNGAELDVCDTDNHRIESYGVSPGGVPTYRTDTVFASPAPAEFNQPVGVSFAGNGDLYVTDSFNQRVVVCRTPSNICDRTFGGIGGTGGHFRYPRGIEVVGSTVWVADSENQRVESFTLAGGFLKLYKPTGTTLLRDYSVAIDPSDGSIWVTDTYHDRIVNFAADGTVRRSWGAGTTKPAGIAVDPKGDVFVSDSGGNRVLKCSASGSCTTLAGPGTSAGHVENPNGLTVVGDELYVADSNNNRVQVFSLTGSFVMQFGQGVLGSPRDAAVDPSGTYAYVTNNQKNSISVWRL
ncbi:MAG: tripartite motif-containing protein 71 [Nocardioidaceae bacterium]|jgi:DNA-binding beta-propeller fold protein YncE|nr:tripartite motif-containing protein 71 [Nocardioidaceae bacterium]